MLFANNIVALQGTCGSSWCSQLDETTRERDANRRWILFEPAHGNEQRDSQSGAKN